ncbi:MAG: chromosome segregation protein SMC [Bacteroidota bacterium]
MSEEKNAEDHSAINNPAGKSRTAVYIIIAVMLLAIMIYFFYQNQQLKEESRQQQKEIANAVLQLDSISGELDLRISRIQQLGGDIDTLEALKAQLEADKKQLLVDAEYQRGKMQKLNDRVSGYRDLLLLKDEEIENLKVMNEQLTEENTTLKVQKNILNDSIKRLEQNKLELVKKVATASRLEAANLSINAINERGKERSGGEYRNRHIQQLKIEFTVLENEIAPIEGKNLLVRVVAPDGKVLFDVSRGSGSFTFENRELFYTAKQEILYDRQSQKVSFLYTKGSEYALGQHTIEIYTDEYVMGTGNFVVK